MQINTEKFFALTATLAGFLPGAACVLSIDTSGTATEGQTTTTTSTTSETTDVTSSGGTTGGTTGMTGTMGTTEMLPTTGGSTTGESTSGTTGDPSADCCTVHPTPGCGNPDIEACVCAEDAFCCGAAEGNWDETCVGQVNLLGCGMCEIDTGGPDTTGEGGGTDTTDTGAGSSSTG